MPYLRIRRILLGFVSGMALIALSLGFVAAVLAQAETRPSSPMTEFESEDLDLSPYLDSFVHITDSFIEMTMTVDYQQVDTNIGSMLIWGGGNNAQIRMHMQHKEDNVQYQFNFNEGVIIRDEAGQPIGVALSGHGEQSGYGPFDATAEVRRTAADGVFILVNGMPLPSNGLRFEAKGSLTFEEPDPRQ
jgi:hypothetical protein